MRQIQATLAALNGSYHLQEPPNRSDSNRMFSFQDVPHDNFLMFLRYGFFRPFYQFSGLQIYYRFIISADPCRQQGERVRGGLTSNKGRCKTTGKLAGGNAGGQEKARFEASF